MVKYFEKTQIILKKINLGKLPRNYIKAYHTDSCPLVSNYRITSLDEQTSKMKLKNFRKKFYREKIGTGKKKDKKKKFSENTTDLIGLQGVGNASDHHQNFPKETVNYFQNIEQNYWNKVHFYFCTCIVLFIFLLLLLKNNSQYYTQTAKNPTETYYKPPKSN